MENLPYLLVAEKSLLNLIGHSIAALEKYANPARIYVVVPAGQLEDFNKRLQRRVTLVSEDELLPQWPLSRVRSALPKLPDRAGWYLQQFLKLGFGQYSGLSRYVIWDADTVMLRTPSLERDGQVLMNSAREYHQPYFDTYQRLFGRAPTLPRSVISQYMLIDSSVCLAMQKEISERHQGRDWIDVILRGLPGACISEFSEYETYANYCDGMFPGRVKLQASKWFRYGTDVSKAVHELTLDEIERRFRKYSYVAFERHRITLRTAIAARVYLFLGIGS